MQIIMKKKTTVPGNNTIAGITNKVKGRKRKHLVRATGIYPIKV